MKLRVETQKPVKLNLTDTQTNAPLSHSTTIIPMPAMQIGEVTTLPPGSDATASFTGDPRTPELNLGIPRGATGAQGPQGIQGERGPQGPKGDTGDKGDKGDTGDKGDKGDKGAKGDTGAQGPEGPQGPQGPTGANGKDGADGKDGKDGKDGSDYVLTAADKTEIANIVLGELPIYNGGVS